MKSHEEKTLSCLFEALAERGESVALFAFREGQLLSWSSRDLYENICSLASGLKERGFGEGDRGMILGHNRLEWIIACLGIIAAGGVAVPVDVQLEDEVLGHILEDSGVKLVFTDSGQADRVDRVAGEGDLTVVVLDGSGEKFDCWRSFLSESQGFRLPDMFPEDPAVLFYTSGTTHLPKGVILTQGNLGFELSAVADLGLLSAGSRVMVPLPFHHVYPFMAGLLVPLLMGLPIVLPEALTGPEIIKALKDGQVTALVGVPRLYRALYSGILDQAQARGKACGVLVTWTIGLCTLLRRLGVNAGRVLLRGIRQRLGPDLRLLTCGGAPLDPGLAWRLEAIGWSVASGYGLTETSPLLTVKLPGDMHLNTVGKPIPGVDLRIDRSVISGDMMDAGEQGVDVDREVGEIQVRGPNVFGGYINLPDETRNAFTSDGWFRTGDLGWLDRARPQRYREPRWQCRLRDLCGRALGNQGRVVITGRLSSMIVTESGKNIQPESVEDAYGASPYIRELGVLQQDGKLVGVIVPEGEHIPPGEDVRRVLAQAVRELNRHLPSYKGLSDYVTCSQPLARTRLGKLQRHLLRKRYEQLKSAESHGGREVGLAEEKLSAADRDLLANSLARQVWTLLMNRYGGKGIDLESSLQVDLNIDSLEWLNLTLAIRQATGVGINERVIARIGCVRELLLEVSEAGSEGGAHGVGEFLEQPELYLSASKQKWLKPLRVPMVWLAWVAWRLNQLVMAKTFELQVSGLEHLPTEGACVLASNHASYLDPFVLSAALSFRQLRHTYWGGWTGAAFRNPARRFLSRLAQALPIEPEREVISSLAIAAAILNRDEWLVWFPEGGRTVDGQLMTFKPGIGVLLEHFGVSVVPIVIRGTFEALPMQRHFPRCRPLRIEFGLPVLPGELAHEGEGADFSARVANGLQKRVAGMV